MKTKTSDFLLKELNDVQLSNESMHNIKGGQEQCGYVYESYRTKTGQVVVFYCPATEVYTMYWNGGQMFPHEMSTGDRTLA